MSIAEATKVHNYSAGPCILPQTVFEKASQAVLDYNGTGLSILEMSHRSPAFVEVMENARRLVKEALDAPDHYEVLFLGGGASLGFYISALNFMKAEGSAAYLNTGTWSSKAIKEAKRLGPISVVGSSEDKNFSYIPKAYDVPAGADYLHFTSNNTITGTQFKAFPKSDRPLICDMSSDIFSRQINVADFDLIYAGAQKNLGPAGTTLYIVDPNKLGTTGRDLPSMLDLNTHLKKDSMFNTPPVFPIYVSMLMLEWVKSIGGVEAMERINNDKAELLYSTIDASPLFTGTTAAEDRSNMNATFVLTDEKLGEEFDAAWKAANINGLKGHRSVGGYRASMYNALPLSSVQVLVDVMNDFAQRKG